MPDKTISVPDDVVPIIESLHVPLSRWVTDQLRCHAAESTMSFADQLVADAALAASEELTPGTARPRVSKGGTGKSVVALWAAERLVGEGSRVLYVVPSISLLGQTMREWATQRRTLHRYVGVCSDSSAGRRSSEDANLTELSIPVTTDPVAIADALDRDGSGAMTVVFSTYQSLGVIADVQAGGAAGFDLMICDEAHRTTGVEKKKKGDDTVSVKGNANVSVW